MIPVSSKFNIQHAVTIPFLVAGFILASLCLSAGNKPGFMEEYALVRIDMSDLGNNLFSFSNDTSSDDSNKDDDDEDEDKDDEDDDDGGFLDSIGIRDRRGLSDIFDDAKDKIGELGNELVGGLAEDLGIKDWYSLHILTFCQGEFKNSTKNDTEVDKNGFEVDECSEPNAKGGFNLTEILGGDSLSAGPVDIPIPSGIQRQLQRLYRVILGLIVLYSMTIGGAVLALVTNIFAVVCPRIYPYRVTLATSALANFAAGSAFVGSIATTIGVATISEALGDLGELVGVRAVKGWQFLAITWSMFGVVFIAAAYWTWMFLSARRQRMGETWDELKAARRKIKQLQEEATREYRRGQHVMVGNQIMEKADSVRHA